MLFNYLSWISGKAPEADKSAMCAINRHLLMAGLFVNLYNQALLGFKLHLKDLQFGTRNNLAGPLFTRWALRNEVCDTKLAGAVPALRAVWHGIDQQLGSR